MLKLQRGTGIERHIIVKFNTIFIPFSKSFFNRPYLFRKSLIPNRIVNPLSDIIDPWYENQLLDFKCFKRKFHVFERDFNRAFDAFFYAFLNREIRFRRSKILGKLKLN